MVNLASVTWQLIPGDWVGKESALADSPSFTPRVADKSTEDIWKYLRQKELDHELKEIAEQERFQRKFSLGR